MDDVPRDHRFNRRRSRFTVGRDFDGFWVVVDRLDKVGGLFADRAAAMRFALTESNRAPGQVTCLADDQRIDAALILRAATGVADGARRRAA